MNVRTVKRFSKRTISTLLSVLMVISLFTVCMVATTVTTGAYYDATSGKTITVKPFGNATEWGDTIYLTVWKTGPYSGTWSLTKQIDGTYTGTVGSWSGYEYFYFSNVNSSTYGSIADNQKSMKYYEDLKSDKTFKVIDVSRTNVSCVLYNYRNDYQVFKNNNTAEANKSVQRDFRDDWDNWNQDVDANKETINHSDGYNITFKSFIDNFNLYNTAVSNWFNTKVTANEGEYESGQSDSKKATPLYQGNFRAMNSSGGQAGTAIFARRHTFSGDGLGRDYYNFISVANGANRYHGSDYENQSTRSVARYLVDDQLKDTNGDGVGDTLTQYGIEIPQFSDDFTTNAKASICGSAENPVQWKSGTLNFPFDTRVNSHEHVEYYYNAALDNNNRYYNGSDTLQVGENVYGVNVSNGHGTKNGYYPFNKTNPSNAKDVVNCFGTKFEIQFLMPNTKKIGGNDGTTEEDLVFHFSGDDDVWVYIDGYLALDMGGQHNKAEGEINLTAGTATYKTGYYNSKYETIYDNTDKGMSASTSSAPAGTSNRTDGVFTYKTEDLQTKLAEKLDKERNQKHTITVFYLERGEFDSNFYMDFLLPVVSSDDNELTIKQKVDSSDVNRALRLETMNVANKDIFAASIGTQHMPKGQKNIISLPIGEDFTRRQNLYAEGEAGTTLIQQKNVGSKTAVNNGNSTTDTQYKDIQAYYSWVDESKLLNKYGEETASNAFAHSGVGIPLQNDSLHTHSGILLSYDQSAIFYNQFSTKPIGTALGVGLSISGSSVLFEFISENSNTDGIANRAQNEDRALGDYYTTNLHVQGCSLKTDTSSMPATDFYLHSGGNLYIKENKSYLTYTHKVKTGSFVVEKKLETGETDNDTEYTFKIEYKNLFGIETFIDGDTSWHNAAALVGKLYKNNNTTTDNFAIGLDGTVGLKAGEKIEFSGIPVFTQIRITESPTKKNGSTDEEARVTRVIRQDTLKTLQNTSVNSNTGELTHTFSTSNNGTGVADNTLSTRTESEGIYSSVLLRAEDTNTNNGIKWESDYHYTFYNSYAETPIIYRYHDRNVVNGKPTTLQTGYTYFAKTVPGAVSTFTDSNGVVTTQAKKDIGEMSPQIINVLSTYRLDNTQGSFYHVEVEKTDSGYTFAPKDGSGFTYTSNTDDVAFNETMQSVFEGKTVGTKIEMIVAEYQDSTRYYDFTVEYVKPGDGTSGDYNSYVNSTTLHKKFNDTVDLGTALAGGDAGLSGETLKNEHYKINVGDRTIYFAYWEREVTYRNGDEVVTSYVPVSTNYNYNYKITQDVHIRAVYKDGNKRYDTQEPYVHYDPDIGWDTTVETNYPGEAHEKTYIRYWKQPAGTTEETDRMYTNSPEQAAAGTYPYTYAQANATGWQWYKLSDEVIGLNGYCLPNESGQMGYAAAATDRMYNSYSKEIVKEVSGTNVYSKQDRTRVDITFGSVGSYDNDGDIQNIGYVLFQNDGSYPVLSDEKINKGAVKDIVTEYVKRQSNLINNADNKINYAVDGTNNGTSYTCLIGKFTVASTAQYSNPNYTAQNIGYVNLTNKNRADIVFDIKNTASSRNKYYTCYTYMIRNGTVYVSPQPTTFSLSEADPSLKNPDGKKAYIINTKSYLCETDSNNDITSRTTNTSLPMVI